MAEKKKQDLKDIRAAFLNWLRSSSSICVLMVLITFLIVLGIYLCVCTPRKYDLRVGSISHVTVDATKDVMDEVATEEKRAAAADAVEPTYRFQQGVKEEVLSSLSEAFQELRTIQQYGVTLRPSDSENPVPVRPFSEEEIAYALTLVNTLDLDRTQLTTLLRVDTTALRGAWKIFSLAQRGEAVSLTIPISRRPSRHSCRSRRRPSRWPTDVSAEVRRFRSCRRMFLRCLSSTSWTLPRARTAWVRVLPIS